MTRETAVAGKIKGLLTTGDQVTWEAVHLGVKQRLTVQVTRCEPPYFFEDEMVRGAFKAFTHLHTFREEQRGTMMVDDFIYTSPLGALGALADCLFLERYMRSFLVRRARALKQMAETEPTGLGHRSYRLPVKQSSGSERTSSGSTAGDTTE